MLGTERSGFGEDGRGTSARRRVQSVGLPLVLVLALGISCTKHTRQAPAGPAEVTTVTVVPHDVPSSAEFIAQTQSSRQVNIQARVNGFLEKRVYTEGSVVKEGDVLFLMDKRPFQVQVDGSAAALARQKASMETARLNLERTRPLTELNALAQKDLENAVGQFESAAAAVEQAKAQLAADQLNLSYCTVTSPATGASGAAQQQDGTYISAQNSLLTTVAVLSPIWVNFSISEGEMQRLRERIAKGVLIPPRNHAYEVEILLPDGARFPHEGRLTFADPSFNPATGTFLIRASVLNPDGMLRPNQHVRVRIKGAVRPGAILVPQRAVQQGAKGSFVWVVNRDGRSEPRPVVVGAWLGDDWFIDDGLKAGEQVVVDGGLTLRPGEPVTIKPVRPETPAATPAPGHPAAPSRAKPKSAA